VSDLCITYRIDKDNKIFFLSDEWELFANENSASDLTVESVINQSLFDYISDKECQHIYQILINRSRTKKEKLEFSFRCDSPDKRRFMLMKMTPMQDESIEFKSCIVREEIRDPILLLDKEIERSNDFLTICSWCNKIKVNEEEWVEVEIAIEQLTIFGEKALPKLSHGMCSCCLDAAQKEFN